MTVHPNNLTADHAWSGSRYIDVMNPQPEDMILWEIAVGLSREQRYRGAATRVMWSVGQHSILTLRLMREDGITDRPTLRAGFMHDAPEYILGDVIRAVKRNTPDYVAIEKLWWTAISSRFGLLSELPLVVKQYDELALAVEKKSLISPSAGEWAGISDPGERVISSDLLTMTPVEAAGEFMREAQNLGIAA